MKYTVFYDQINQTNFQVKAKTPEEAEAKAEKLYRNYIEVLLATVQDGWIEESEGEDK